MHPCAKSLQLDFEPALSRRASGEVVAGGAPFPMNKSVGRAGAVKKHLETLMLGIEKV